MAIDSTLVAPAPGALEPWWKEPTKDQWAAFAAAWFGWVLDAFDFTVYLLVLPNILGDFPGVTLTAGAFAIALTQLTRLAGGMVAGWAADRWGRKLPLLISVVWFAVCDGLIAFAPTWTAILVLRTIFGFGMGAEWTAGATLAMESWPKRSRAIASGVLQGSWAVGYLFAALAAALVVPKFGWRGLFITAAIPAVLIFPLMLLVKEPPRAKLPEGQTALDNSFLAIFRTPGVTKKIVWGSAAMAAGLAAYYALTAVYPKLLASFSFDDTKRAWHIAVFNIGMMVGAVICGFIAMRRSVALAIIVPTVAMAICTPLYVGWNMELLMLGAFLGGVFGAGYSGTTPLLLTSLFPDHLRAKSVGLVYHLGALPAAFVPMFVAWLVERHGLSLSMSMGLVIAFSVLALATLVLFGPDEVRAKPASGEAVAH